MKFVPIFDTDNLFAVHYDGDSEHIFDVIMERWMDPVFIHRFLHKHKKDLPKGKSIAAIGNEIIRDAEMIDNTFHSINENNITNLDQYFKPLNNNEYQLKPLQLQKRRENYFRIYAVRVDQDCYIITGGTVKFLHLMEHAEYTQNEKIKLDHCKDYLSQQTIIDTEAFYSYLEEEYDE